MSLQITNNGRMPLSFKHYERAKIATASHELIKLSQTGNIEHFRCINCNICGYKFVGDLILFVDGYVLCDYTEHRRKKLIYYACKCNPDDKEKNIIKYADYKETINKRSLYFL